MIANHFRSHFRGARERLERFRVELLVEEALAVHVVDEGEAVVVLGCVGLQHARLLVVEDGRLEVAHHQRRLASQFVEVDDVGSQVDCLRHRDERLLVLHLTEQVLGSLGTEET